MTLQWKPQGGKRRERPRKIWIDVIEEDLKTLVGVEDWKEVLQVRDTR